MFRSHSRRSISLGLLTCVGGLAIPAATTLAQPAVTIDEAFDIAQAQAPSNVVLEVELRPSGAVWEADSLFPSGTTYLGVEINASTGAVIEAESEPAEPGMAAIAAAFADAEVTWAEAIDIARNAITGAWIRDMDLEFVGGQLVFETVIVDGGNTVTIEISAATGVILGNPPGGSCVGTVDLLGAAAAIEAEFPGLPVIEVDPVSVEGFAGFEVELADASTQSVFDVEVRAADGCLGGLELVPGEPWTEVAQILALLPNATVNRATALAIASDTAEGTSVGYELDVENGTLLYRVDVLTSGGIVEVLVNATANNNICAADLAGPAGSGPDGMIDVSDLLALFAQWGPCSSSCAADLSDPPDGVVNVNDLLALFAAWGACP